MEYLFKSSHASSLIKDVDGKKGIITGYGAVFNNEDSDGDTIISGAFAKTIVERGPQSAQPRIKYLRNHMFNEPIGVLQTLKEDNKGLFYEAIAGTNNVAIDTIKMIESGLITEHSIGYETVRKQVIDADADWRDRKQILQEIKLWELSALTAWGANEQTGAAMLKSMGKDIFLKSISDRHAAIEKFCKNSTATDETIELLLLESKQLTQIILDISNKSTKPEIQTPPKGRKSEKATLPGGVANALTTFKNSLIN